MYAVSLILEEAPAPGGLYRLRIEPSVTKIV